MNRFQRSWCLVKSSFSVIGRNKQLLVFPIVIFICTSIIVGFFLAPPLLRPTGYSYLSTAHWQEIGRSLFSDSTNVAGQHTVVFTRGAMVYLAFLYLLSMFVATFFNVAFYHEILAALGGQAVSLGRGIRFALTKLPSILMWTLLAGLVGLIIKMIEQRLSWAGRLIGKLIGVAWSVAAVFAIPVIVRQQTANPVEVLRNSAQMLRRTWGEALIGYLGLGAINTLVVLGSVIWLVGTIVVASVLHIYWLIAFAVALWLLALFAWSYIGGVASQVYKGALYLYAAEGVVPTPYTQEVLDLAWKTRQPK